MENNRRNHIWTPDEERWLKSRFRRYGKRSSLTRALNKEFGLSLTEDAVNQKLLKLGVLEPNSDYTPEMIEWLRENYRLDSKSVQSLTDEFNSRFNTSKSRSSIWHKANRLTGRRMSPRKTARVRYTDQMLESIRDLVPVWSYRKTAEIMTETFGYPFTASMIEHKANRIGVGKGNDGYHNKDPRMENLGCFRTGVESIRKKPVGTETVMQYSDGKMYIHIKTGEPNVWKFKHRLVWERENGPVPEGHAIIFLDGDTTNCDIGNLACISRRENAILNQKGYRFEDAGLTKTAVNVARLIVAKNDRRRKK